MKRKSPVLLIGILSLCLSVFASGQKKSWETIIQTGDNALTQNRYADAEQAYREALTIAEKFKEKDPRIAATLIKLAESVSRQSRREEAEILANRALLALDTALKSSKSKDAEEGFYKSDGSAIIFDKAATILEAGQKYAEAEALYKKVIALREEAVQPKKSPKSNEDFLGFLVQAVTGAQAKLADAYDKLASFYLAQRKFDEAESFYLKALKVLEAQYGVDEPPTAIGLSRLATLSAMQGKYDKAEPLFSRAINIFENSNWLDRSEVATTFENYSLLLRSTGREAEAATMLEKAKAIRNKIKPN